MKVKCICNKKLNTDNLYQGITIGQVYIILEIEFCDRSNLVLSKNLEDFIVYKIRDNYGIVSPFPSVLFEIVSEKLSSIWVCKQDINNTMSFLPKQWVRKGFWEDYYNDEQSALEDFDKAYKKMYVEELSGEEINNIIEYGDLREIDFALEALIQSKDTRSKLFATKVASLDKCSNLWTKAFSFLINFKEDDVVVNLFVDFLLYNEKTKPEIAKIVNEYLSQNK